MDTGACGRRSHREESAGPAEDLPELQGTGTDPALAMQSEGGLADAKSLTSRRQDGESCDTCHGSPRTPEANSLLGHCPL